MLPALCKASGYCGGLQEGCIPTAEGTIGISLVERGGIGESVLGGRKAQAKIDVAGNMQRLVYCTLN